MMRLTGQKIFDATQVLAAIINEKRRLPAKGIYRVTKMHVALYAEFSVLNDQRTAKIMSYGHKQYSLDGRVLSAEEATTANAVEQDAVPDDKMTEFIAWWQDLASVESNVNIEPIPIEQLSLGDDEASTLTYAEFATLGDLVAG